MCHCVEFSQIGSEIGTAKTRFIIDLITGQDNSVLVVTYIG